MLYAYQAVMMIKLDKELRSAHEQTVPDYCSDESFWRNYFYEIQYKMDQLGEFSSLGPLLTAD